MTRLLSFVVTTLAVVCFCSAAQAKPNYGATCKTCHGSTTGNIQLRGNTKLLDLGTKRKDGVRVGALKTYVVKRGATVPITIRVLNGSSRYDTDVYMGTTKGLQGSLSHRLRFTADPKWKLTGSPAYYLFSSSKIAWKGKFVDQTFNLKVASNAAPDVYEVFVNIGGKGNGLWAQQERIYIQVTP